MRGDLSCFGVEDLSLIADGLKYIPSLAYPLPGANFTDTVP
jgi:hypothetical protein